LPSKYNGFMSFMPNYFKYLTGKYFRIRIT
jgi:hypothetical protein